LPNFTNDIGCDISSEGCLHGRKHGIFSIDRLPRLFIDLLNACIELGKYIVMFLDDIHWADNQSWDIMLYLIQESKLKRIFIITTYRADDICPSRESIVQALSNSGYSKRVNLTDWDITVVNQLVASLLRMSTTKTESLARVVYAKSTGNPFFTIEVLKAIDNQNLLQFSFKNFCWKWDDAMIQLDINICDNLVDLILSRFHTLPFHLQNTLILASCFGPKFDGKLLQVLWNKFYGIRDHEDAEDLQIISHLGYAVNEGIIDSHVGSYVYRFAHDKIYDAIYSQVSKLGSFDEVHLRIGRILLLLESEHNDDRTLIFLTARQFNQSLHLIDTSLEAIQVAKMNLEAAKASISLSAYYPAADYLHHGLLANKQMNWAQYDLQFELLLLQAKVQLSLCNYPKCHEAVEEILENAETNEEKIPVFEICIDAYGAEGNLEKCFQQGLLYARLLLKGNIPKRFNKATVILAFLTAKRLMKNKTSDMLLNYRMTKNPSINSAVRILDTVVIYAFQTQDIDMMATLAFLNTSIILREGFTDEAGSILALYGFLLACMGDLVKGYVMGRISLEIAEKMKSGIPRTFMHYYGGLDHLRNPLHQSLEPLMRAYRIGLEMGDSISGFFCCHFYITIFYFVGLPLSTLLRDMNSFSKEMGSYHTYTTYNFSCIHHQSVINLTSNVTNPTTLDGEVMNEQSLLNCGVILCQEAVWFGKLILATYFNEYEVMRENLDNLVYRRAKNADGCIYYINILLWAEGLGAIMVARRTRRRKYRVLALSLFRKMEKLVKNGNVNCCHSLLHLQAEMAILLRQQVTQVKKLFDSAISTSRRAGLSNFVAVINERAALYFLDMNDMEWASSYMRSAFEMYHRWGAIRKCWELLKDHKRLLPKSIQIITSFETLQEQSVAGTYWRGCERLNKRSSDMHSDKSLDLFSTSVASNFAFRKGALNQK
jgi:predicted ATPase